MLGVKQNISCVSGLILQISNPLTFVLWLHFFLFHFYLCGRHFAFSFKFTPTPFSSSVSQNFTSICLHYYNMTCEFLLIAVVHGVFCFLKASACCWIRPEPLMCGAEVHRLCVNPSLRADLDWRKSCEKGSPVIAAWVRLWWLLDYTRTKLPEMLRLVWTLWEEVGQQLSVLSLSPSDETKFQLSFVLIWDVSHVIKS